MRKKVGKKEVKSATHIQTKVSPLSEVLIHNRLWHVKRDDLIHPQINGNKYRKLQFLIQKHPSQIDTIISFGGHQSNAMAALAELCKIKGWQFVYLTRPLPAWLRESPNGNLERSLRCQMQLKEVGAARVEYLRTHAAKLTKEMEQEGRKALLVPMGAAMKQARQGLNLLAQEIRDSYHNSQTKPLIVLSAGTGASAAFLAESLPDFKLHAFAALGSAQEVRRQIVDLTGAEPPQNLTLHQPDNSIPHYAFAKPQPQFLKLYYEILPQLEFDLIYDIPTLYFLERKIFAHLEQGLGNRGERDHRPLFIHSGGTEGNGTQLLRYKRAGLLV